MKRSGGVSPARVSASRTRSSRSAAPPPSPWTRSGSSTVARTRKRGSSDSYGSWKISWACRRSARILPLDTLTMSSPRKRIVPDSGSTRRRIDWAVVVLPLPDSPTSASISPLRSENETPSTAWTARFGRRAAAPTRPRGTGKRVTRFSTSSRTGSPFSLTTPPSWPDRSEWHAARWSVPVETSRGLILAHGANELSQRSVNGQPVSSRSSRGGVPGMETTSSSP